ncbi:hypothetical protein CLOSTMETH_02493 [[Clostridium] methylpentosum DSM 5476]|uniref:Zinc-ribbon domain-containing protein n=1 Tax=[Clostridium] methylpentosum DSM 5476 TaxID=537013 RepID=C0EF52_9FIRM|nr:hypothetical protein CLOSTMETH_02493 [[Clostridium] methylpentosum DSM 5476]
MDCKKCKKEIPEESTYCNFCGAPKRQKPKRQKRAETGRGAPTSAARHG